MKGTLRLITVLAAVFVMSGLAVAQTNPIPDIFDTRNIAAGTVNDAGSQLLYIADTGINLRANPPAPADQGKNIADLLYGGSDPDPGTILKNFISITNTHPTKAVTIHFRYFADNCLDVLDFLVVLTCNDTLLMDPYDFDIPGAQLDGQQVNTADRIFGPDLSTTFPAIPASVFQSGRFIILANAAGTVRFTGNEPGGPSGYGNTFDADIDPANILFPSELAASDCNFDSTGNFRAAGIIGPSPGARNVGSGSGFSVQNLHVFNASAVWFNHLVGHHTVAIPKFFIPDGDGTDQFLAVGVNAYARPGVDRNFDLNDDGDGAPISGVQSPGGTDYLLLTGGEVLWDSTTRCAIGAAATATCTTGPVTAATNFYYLRSEIHGGTLGAGVGNASDVDYGALAWTSIHGGLNANNLAQQRVEFLSVYDDYNGSNNANTFLVNGITTFDRAYALEPARTVYIVQLYDNDENQLTLTGEEPILISPPPTVPQTSNMRIIVDCLRVWVNNNQSPSNETAGGLSLEDLTFVEQVTDGGPGFPNPYKGLFDPTIDPQEDASAGWIRFVRDNPNGGTEVNSGRLGENTQASFVTIGQVLVKFEGFGASWWLATSSSDPAISDSDPNDPTPVILDAG